MYTVSLSALKLLVVDEADLVLSYGFEDDLRALLALLSRSGSGVGHTFNPDKSDNSDYPELQYIYIYIYVHTCNHYNCPS